MEFLNPRGIWLFLLVIPLLLLYILRIRLRREPVSTMLFWNKVFQQRRSRAFWKKLRYFLSLLIALLFMTLLGFAVVNPVWNTLREEKIVIVFDNSASMNAVNPVSKRTHLETAKHDLSRFLEHLPMHTETAILTTRGQEEIAAGFTNHRGTLKDMVRKISPSDSSAPLESVIRFARKRIEGEENARILVWTDGCSELSREILSGEDITIFSVNPENPSGLDSPVNLAITQFQARRSYSDPLGLEVFLEIVNFSDRSVDFRLILELGQNLLDVIPLHLEPQARESHVLTQSSERGGILKASLDFPDALAVDNVVYAIVPDKPLLNILLFGKESFFLFQAFQSQPRVQIQRIEEIPEEIPENTLLVFHRDIPESVPTGNVLIVDPENDFEGFQVGDPLERAVVSGKESKNPLLRFVQLKNVFVPGARKLVLPGETNSDFSPVVLLESMQGDPLYVQWSSPLGKRLLLTIGMDQGDFALRTAFPVLISNAIRYFRNESTDMQRAYNTRDPVEFSFSPSEIPEKRMILRSPRNTEREIPIQGEKIVFGTLSECGLWELRTDSGKVVKFIACNLVDEKESDLRPKTVFSDSTREISVGGSRPIWFWCTLAALLLCTTEWYLFHRRWIE